MRYSVLLVFSLICSLVSSQQNETIKLEFTKLNSTDRSISAPQTEKYIQLSKATFLPKDHWMVFNTAIGKNGLAGYNHQIKLYSPGTFQNRFSKLGYKGYLEANHRIVDFGSSTFKYNKTNGIHPFYGYKIAKSNEFVYGFYAYDLVEDKIRAISNFETSQRQILDYNASDNQLLLSLKEFYNSGYTEPQEFVLLKGNEITKIEGKYKFGKFSNDGDYLLLISDKNELLLKKLDSLKTILKEQLVDGEYYINSFGENEFSVGVDFYTIDFGKCNQESIIIFKNEKGEHQAQKTDCALITDIATKGEDKVSMISKGLGLFLENKVMPYELTEFPEQISYNSDGSRLILSFNNGKIEVFNPQTKTVLGAMQHPTPDSHVYYDAQGNYFSNVDPEDYLKAIKNDKSISFKTIENTYFRPEKILKIFGHPNPEYVALLERAMALKAKNKFEIANVESNESKQIPEDKKGDLYLLSVGVSEYEQSDYNLTFADKDALDMAKIYGKLSEDDLAEYKTKFYGNQFILHNTNDAIAELRKYSGKYNSLHELHPLTTDGNYWLEASNDSFLIWNFKSESIQPIAMPKDFSMGVYNFEPVLFANPDNDGFYLKTNNNEFFEYSFSKERFNKIEIPKSLADQDISTNDLVLLKNNRWAHFASNFDGSKNEILITFGEIDKEDVKYQAFNPNVYKLNPQDNSKVIDSADIYSTQIKALSTNGAHLVYGDLEGHLFYKDLRIENELPQKLNIENLESSDEVSISDDGQTLSVIRRNSKVSGFKIENYDRKGDLLDTSIIKENVVGFSNFDNNPKWISMTDALVKEEFINPDDLLEKAQPVSFTSVTVRHLVNEGATSKSIVKEIKEVFKNAKPEDQIVLFLAGHGVLDRELNYYYAAHDMDFNDVNSNGLGFRAIIESLNSSKANNKLLLMDTCHSGNTLDMESGQEISATGNNGIGQRGSKSRSTEDPKPEFKLSDIVSDVFEDFLSKSGITVISASSGEDVAYENKALGNGAFTSAYIGLLKTKLKAGGFVITKEELNNPITLTDTDITELLKRVNILTNGKQTPDLRELNSESTLKMW
ncbi:caspase family protein [Winogradskyella ursingii]|uniref:caspase family protein n=1 Tax=Winogradskyella ursingii TaxID=2686079 RepID=UPI0015CE3FBF|nr:caspase family protein [Winogradskyella ursingii]